MKNNMVSKSNPKKYFYAVGRRRSSITTIKLFKGKNTSTINGIELEKYFPQKIAKIIHQRPFIITETLDKYYFEAKINGGGKMGQVDSLALAISRSLVKIDEGFKPSLRQAGLLTVDSRIRERRMVGTGGKSRRKKQSPKR
jgi:small subunit ribosomal protein S9